MFRKLSIYFKLHSKVRVLALAICVGLVSAFVGDNCIDIDHPLFYLGWLSDSRAFHPYLVLAGNIFTICGSVIVFPLLRRFYRKARVLK